MNGINLSGDTHKENKLRKEMNSDWWTGLYRLSSSAVVEKNEIWSQEHD